MTRNVLLNLDMPINDYPTSLWKLSKPKSHGIHFMVTRIAYQGHRKPCNINFLLLDPENERLLKKSSFRIYRNLCEVHYKSFKTLNYCKSEVLETKEQIKNLKTELPPRQSHKHLETDSWVLVCLFVFYFEVGATLM